MIPNPGTYRGRVNGAIVIYESEGGALCAAVPVIIPSDDWQWTGKHTMTIVKKDGTLQSRTIDTLKKVFGWDGQDPFWLQDQDFSAVEFDLVGIHDTYTPEGSDEAKTIFKIQWMNAPGESGFKMPDSADRKSILAKYGSKFRALSGGKVVTPAARTATQRPAEQEELAPASKAKGPAPKASGPPAPAKRKNTAAQARTSTMEEAWAALSAANPDINDEAVLAEKWYAILEEMFPGKDNGDFTIQEWGTAIEKIES